MKSIVDELEVIGRPMDDKDLIVTICSGLWLMHNSCTCSFKNKVDKLELNEVKSRLLAFESHLTQQDKFEEGLMYEENIATINKCSSGGSYKKISKCVK